MEALFNTFVVLFIVIDPVGLAPMFLALTHGASVAQQRKMALRGTTLAAAMLLIFFFIGDKLLAALGIGLPAFRIAGGALLFLLAIDMVFARHSGLRSTTRREQQEAEHKDDVSVFPLAFPLIAGPGALTTVLLMSSAWSQPLQFVGMLAVQLMVLGMTLVSLWWAGSLLKFLGETGTNVISRLFGLVLAALAVQYILDGLRAALAALGLEHREFQHQFAVPHRDRLHLAAHALVQAVALFQHVERLTGKQLARHLFGDGAELVGIFRRHTVDMEFVQRGIIEIDRTGLGLEAQPAVDVGLACQSALLHRAARDIEAEADTVAVFAQYHLRPCKLHLVKRIGVFERKQPFDLALQVRLAELDDKIHCHRRRRQQAGQRSRHPPCTAAAVLSCNAIHIIYSFDLIPSARVQGLAGR